jgi:hypothetical protein
MSTKKESKHVRTCGFCHAEGHNVRSCPKKKAAEAAGQPAVAAAAPSTALALVETPTMSEGSPGAAHMPIEFEETKRQVHCNGTTLCLSYRTFDAGLSQLTLRFQREAAGAKDIQFDQEVAVKLYELLGWAMQRQSIRTADLKALAHRTSANGAGLTKAEARS